MIILIAALAAQPAPLATGITPVSSLQPDAVMVPFEPARIISRPNASARHALLAGGPAIPPEGVPFTVRCQVSSYYGVIANCEAPDAPAAWQGAVLGLASLYRFDLAGLAREPDNSRFTVTIADRIMPRDVRPPDRLFRFADRPAGQVVFTAALSPQETTALYPAAAIRRNEQALMQVDCQVQADLSLFCLDADNVPGRPPLRYLGRFQLATYQIVGSSRVTPTLDNGAPAVGTIFRRTIGFRLPEE